MKIHWGYLLGGVVIGGGLAYYYDQKVRVPNAFALGQTYPTQAYASLTAQQKALLMQQPPLQSPPSASALAGGAVATLAATPAATAVTTAAQSVGQAVGGQTLVPAPTAAHGYSAGSFHRSIFGTVLVG